MKKVEVEIYSDASNHAVMRHPGRNFPGSLIQGDSLSILCSRADAARQALDVGDLEEARGELEELRELLWGRHQFYTQVLEESGIEGYVARGEPNPPLETYEDD